MPPSSDVDFSAEDGTDKAIDVARGVGEGEIGLLALAKARGLGEVDNVAEELEGKSWRAARDGGTVAELTTGACEADDGLEGDREGR